MKPVWVYILLQVPGWGLASGVLWWCLAHDLLRPTTALMAFVLWVLKDAALFPMYRSALTEQPARGAAGLIGKTAIVTVALSPRGQVRIEGERWSARADGAGVEAFDGLMAPVPPGSKVRVYGARGLVLLVEPDSPKLRDIGA